MGAREDFEAVRRAAVCMEQRGMKCRWEEDDPSLPTECSAVLLFKASANEAAFIRLAKADIQAEVIDLAYALLGEERPGGPAVQPVFETEKET